MYSTISQPQSLGQRQPLLGKMRDEVRGKVNSKSKSKSNSAHQRLLTCLRSQGDQLSRHRAKPFALLKTMLSNSFACMKDHSVVPIGLQLQFVQYQSSSALQTRFTASAWIPVGDAACTTHKNTMCSG